MHKSDNKIGKYPGRTFPPHNVPNREKDSKEYGAAVAKGIGNEWFDRESGNTRFYKNRYRFNQNRRYAVGDQNIQKYKDEFSINGDLSYLNLDFTPVPIIPKFVDIVVNGMSDRDYTIQATAVDQSSSERRRKFIDRLRKEIENRGALQTIGDAFGADVFENKEEELPKNNDELEIYLELDYKHGSEIAIEKAIDYIFKNNKYEQTKHRFDYDLVTLGIGCVKHEFCPVEGVKIKYVDPEDLVYSYTENKYMDDCFYFGEVKRVHISQLMKEFPELSKPEIDEILKFGKTWNDNTEFQYENDHADSDFVDVLYFCYKTTENETHKIVHTPEGGERPIERDETFQGPEGDDAKFEKISRVSDTIYEGAAIFGSTILLKWEKAKNLVRPSYDSPKTMLPFIACQTKDHKGKIYSLVDRMIKWADSIQITHMKLQQVKQKMTPPGVYLDADGLAEIDLGNGTQYNPQEALNMYFQTGSVIGRSQTYDNDYNHGKVPIQELPGGGGNQIQLLIAEYEYNINQIRQVTGLNEARDGSNPDPNALVGVQKLAAANSNVATRHILMSSMYLTEELASGCALRFAQILEHSPRKQTFIESIGKYNVEILDDLKELHLHEFGIFIELGPDEEEKAMLEANIQASLAKDLLKPEDAFDIRRIKNYKLANQMLKVKRKQREAAEQQAAQANAAAQAQAQAEAAQVIEQGKQQTIQMKASADVSLEEAKMTFDIQKYEAEKEQEIAILMLKHELDMERLGVEMQHQDEQNTKASQDAVKLESAKVDNKQNTVDTRIKSPGYIGGI